MQNNDANSILQENLVKVLVVFVLFNFNFEIVKSNFLFYLWSI